MYLALIPPIGFEAFAMRSKYQMALAFEPCMVNHNRTAKLKEAADRGDFIILDNGANEGAVATSQQIKNYGDQIGATEIVLPDVLDSHIRTVNAVKKFLTREENVWDKFKQRMAVVQGANVAAALTCIEQFASMPAINTLGIPRRIIDNFISLSARIDLANKVVELFPGRFQIHFLGAHAMWPSEIRYAHKYTGARSMDTSLPFNWAFMGARIDSPTVSGIGRPMGYFTSTKDINLQVLQHNITKALEWAGGETPSSR